MFIPLIKNIKQLLQKNNNIRKFIVRHGVLVIFLIFLLMTFGFFCSQSFSNQEMNYLSISEWNIKKIVFDNYGDQLPFWFLLLKSYTSLFGNSEIALRIFSVTIFLLSAFVLSKLCEIYKVNKYLVTALFLFNPLLFEDAAYELKHWGFLVLLCLSTLLFFEKFKISKNKKYAIFFFFTIFIGIYSNLIFLIYLPALGIYLLVNAITKEISFKFLILSAVILIIFILPLSFYYQKAETQLVDIQGVYHMGWGASTRGLNFIKESLTFITGTIHLNKYNYNTSSKILVLIIWVFILIQFFPKKEILKKYRSESQNLKRKQKVNLLFALFFSDKKRKRIYPKIWLISTVFFILIVLMFLAPLTPIRFRYIAPTIPLFYLAIFPRSKKFYVTLLGIVLLLLTSFSTIQTAKNLYSERWKEATSFMKPLIKKESQLFIMYNRDIGPYITKYYLNEQAQRLYKIENAILYSDDVWIIRRTGDYKAIYRLASEYNIEEHDFRPITLIHLTKKSGSEFKKHIIFKNPLVEVITDKKTETFQFSNGAISPDCCEEEWQRIRLNKIKSGGVEKICLFAHPRNNTEINLSYENIKLDEAIRFTTGIVDYMVIGDRSPVYMDVYADNVFLKRIIQPDKKGWLISDVDTSQYENKSAELKLIIYTDYDNKRHFCFDAEIINKKVRNDYFYRNLKNAKATIDNSVCQIYRADSIWPHNEKEPPFRSSKIFERWDCEEDLIAKGRIWNTIGKSYAVSDNEFREAIWMHPLTNKVKSLKYENINLSPKKIIGFYGLDDYATPNIIEANLTFTITVNGKEVYEDKFVPIKGWKEFEIPLNKKLDDVVFNITTTNNRWNHFFFNTFLED